jgi:multicomponent Na+:H+ antiporter subunit A
VVLFLMISPLREWLTKRDVTGKYGPARCYDAGLSGILRLAAWQTRILQNGYLRIYLITIVLTTVILVGGLTLFSRSLPPNIFFVTDVKIHEIGLAAVILIAALMVVQVTSRLAAVAALGVVGYGVGILYVMFGAPDLAITQFVIETLTVILFVLVFYRLEGYKFASSRMTRIRDAIISLSAGALMTVLVLLSGSSGWFPSISGYYGEHSVSDAHGRNIVNVILVDFRGIDTLGEITVLSLAGIGVFALLKLRPPREEDPT